MKKLFPKILDAAGKINYILDVRQKRDFIILIIVFIIGAFLELFGVSAVAPLISLLTDQSVFYTNGTYVRVCRMLHITTVTDMAFWMSLGIALVYVLKNIYLCMQYDLMYKYTYNNQHKISVRMLRCYLKQDYLYHVSNNVADLHRNITTDVNLFMQCLLYCMHLISEVFVCLFLAIFLLATEFTLTMCAILVLSVFMLTFLDFSRKRVTGYGERNRQKTAHLNRWILQSFGGIKDIKALGREPFFIGRYDEDYMDYAESVRKYQFLTTIQKPVIEAGCFGGLLVLVAIRIKTGINLNSLVASLGVLAVAAFRMLPSFNRISEHINNILYTKASITSMYEDLKELKLLEESMGSWTGDGYIDPSAAVHVKDVSFRYPEGEADVLENISLIIKPNVSIGIIGASGEGKSTFADIILGLIRPDKGDIEIGGRSIFDNVDAWHKIVGYIPQALYLMDDSIRNNIAFGISEDEIDDERIMQVIEEAQLSDFISSLPDGIDTFVGDRGIRLSGGQRQRIGIARALYPDPKFLVLDEATSALDNDTEAAVMEAIDRLHGSRTMLIIAHRLTTIKNCDEIYEVSGGTLIKRNKEMFI